MRVILYTGFGGSHHLASALYEGFKTNGDHVTIDQYDQPYTFKSWLEVQQTRQTQLAVFVGKRPPAPELYRWHTRASHHTLVIDTGVFDIQNYSLVLDGEQKLPFKPTNNMRLEYLLGTGLVFKPHIVLDKKILKNPKVLFVSARSDIYAWHGTANPQAFDRSILTKLLNRNDKLHITYHSINNTMLPMKNVTSTFILDMPVGITQFNAVVTTSKQVAALALLNGIPVTMPRLGTKPILPYVNTSLDNIYYELEEDKRLELLNQLSFYEFTLSEIQEGYAWDCISQLTSKRLDEWADEPDFDPNSEQYLIEQYRMMHAMDRYNGSISAQSIYIITELVQETEAKTLLDYGSGKGRQYEHFQAYEEWGCTPHCYDPAYAKFAAKPTDTFDGVICTDVAEHIPTDAVPSFLSDVISYADKFAYFCIYVGPATKFLPDGRNAHLTVKDPTWWLNRLCDALYQHYSKVPTDQLVDITKDDYYYTLRTDTFKLVVMFRGTV